MPAKRRSPYFHVEVILVEDAQTPAAMAEFGRILRKTQARLNRERLSGLLPEPTPPPKPTFTEEELRRRPRYRGGRRRRPTPPSGAP